MRYKVREMQTDDVERILQIQARLYPATLLESADLFFNRLALSPGTSFVAHVESELLGYLLAYPWTQSTPPELNVALSTLPQDANSWFLHDCSVLPEAQGAGIAHSLYKAGAAHAVNKGLCHSSLVSLATAKSYWLRYGYTIMATEGDSVLTAKLAGYGSGACFMTRQLRSC